MRFASKNKKTISYLIVISLVLSIFLGFVSMYFNININNELIYKNYSSDFGMIGTKNANSFSGFISINNYAINFLSNFDNNSLSNSFRFSKDKNTKYIFKGFFDFKSFVLCLMFTLLCIMLCITQIEKKRKTILEGDGGK